jgi:hypothetical protein
VGWRVRPRIARIITGWLAGWLPDPDSRRAVG